MAGLDAPDLPVNIKPQDRYFGITYGFLLRRSDLSEIGSGKSLLQQWIEESFENSERVHLFHDLRVEDQASAARLVLKQAHAS